MSKIEYEELIAFHPGYYVKEIIEDMGITQSEFAQRLNTTDKTLCKLVNAEISLSDDLAQKLAQMMGTSVKVWLDLQTSYTEKILEIKKRKALDEEKRYLKILDYSYFRRLHVVKDTRNSAERIAELHKFFKVSSLSVLGEKDFLVACKTAVQDVTEKNIVSSNAWIQTALNGAEKMVCKPFNKKRLQSYLPEIRTMTLQDPSAFFPRLCALFQECGVAFILLPHLKNSGVNGAVKWINPEKVLLAINNRRLYADVFWFSLFHEIRHILQQKIKETFISSDKTACISCADKELEADADRFAGDYLIARGEYERFIGNKTWNENNVRIFAQQVGIHPGVVVGRLQHDGHLDYNQLINLKEKYEVRVD